MEFTKDLFKARIIAGLPSAQSLSRNGSGSRIAVPGASSIDLSGLINIPEDDSFIRESYRRVLNRECDPGSFVDCLDLLRRHTPRRVLLQQLVQSEEAQRRGVGFEGLPPQSTPQPAHQPVFPRLRRLLLRGYDFLRRFWHAPFVSLDQKLTLILRELSNSIDEIKQKSDRNLFAVSEKLDAYAVAVQTQKKAITDVGDRAARMEEKCLRIEENHLRAGETFLRIRSQIEESHFRMSSQLEAHGKALQNLTANVSALTNEISRLAASQESALKSYRKPPILLGGNDIFITELDGFIIGQPGDEWRMAAFHALRGVMEPGLVRRLQQLLQPGMTFVDIGANIGVLTLHAAVCVAPNGKVHSFEPAPRTFQILKDNVQVNGLLESGLIELHPEAVSNVVGVAQLSIFNRNSGHNTLFGNGGNSRVSVHTVTLDAVLDGAPVDVVKIDAEGAEPLILRGMRKTIDANPQIVILLEFAPSHLQRAGVDAGSFLADLESAGFKIQQIDNVTGDLHEPDPARLVETFSVNLQLTRTQ